MYIIFEICLFGDDDEFWNSLGEHSSPRAPHSNANTFPLGFRFFPPVELLIRFNRIRIHTPYNQSSFGGCNTFKEIPINKSEPDSESDVDITFSINKYSPLVQKWYGWLQSFTIRYETSSETLDEGYGHLKHPLGVHLQPMREIMWDCQHLRFKRNCLSKDNIDFVLNIHSACCCIGCWDGTLPQFCKW
jgi:hypothetical protein